MKVESERLMGWAWLWITSGMPNSTAHLRAMEFINFKAWFQT